MGKQFQLYLLPSDTTRLVEVLRREAGIRLLAVRSPRPEPVEGDLPIRTEVQLAPLKCLLAPDLSIPAQFKLDYIEKQNYWIVNTLFSDVIEFSGCYFDEKTLQRGRLFYNPGFFSAEEWQEKSPQFLRWADRLFKTAKKSLKRIPSVDAYVGADAERWRSAGGVFVALAIKGRPPLVAK
jgi:hypothetical protein